MKPSWLKVKVGSGENFYKVMETIKKEGLHTICHEANCPNLGECFSRGTATFMILGDICTRNCRYCNVKHGKPAKTDYLEPKRIANAVKKLNLKYVVITSVTRDDLKDYGAKTFRNTIKEIRKISDAKIEILTPDFNLDINALKKVIAIRPDVFAHNIETVERLFPTIRPKSNFRRSIVFLKKIKELNPKQITKSGMMVGLGETKKEIIKTIKTLKMAKVDIFTIGQYLQPRKDLAEVKRYYTPDEFLEFKNIAYKLGFKLVFSGPLVRSSYHAEEAIKCIGG